MPNPLPVQQAPANVHPPTSTPMVIDGLEFACDGKTVVTMIQASGQELFVRFHARGECSEGVKDDYVMPVASGNRQMSIALDPSIFAHPDTGFCLVTTEDANGVTMANGSYDAYRVWPA